MADSGDQPGPYDHLTMEEKQAIVRGKCNFLALSLLSTIAFIQSGTAAGYCDFAAREVNFVPGFDQQAACSSLNLTGYSEFEQYYQNMCNVFFTKHGVGFYGWYATVPVDTQICLSYDQFVYGVGWVTPEFDAAFEAARVFAIMANIWGAMAWFTIMFSSCCPMDNARIKGLSCYFTLAYICQAFTFLLFASNVCRAGFLAQYFPNLKSEDKIVDSVVCKLGSGGSVSVSATVIYFVGSMVAPVSLAPLPIGYRPVPAQAQTTNNANEATGDGV